MASRTTSMRSSGRRKSSRSTRSSAARIRIPNYLVGGVPCSHQHRRSHRHQHRAAEPGRHVSSARRRVRRPGLHPRPAGGRRRSTRTGAAIGGGLKNYLCYGDLPTKGYGDPDYVQVPARRHPRSRPQRGASGQRDATTQEIKEYIAHSWYTYAGGDEAGLHPWAGETEAQLHRPEAAVRAARTSKASTRG